MPDGSPFRKESLERLSSPERLDQLLQVVDRKSWLPLTTLAVLVTAAVVWAFVGRVPVNAHGRGILVHPRDLVPLQASAAGYLSELSVAVGDAVRPGQVVARSARPEIEKQIDLERARLEQLTAQLAGGAADPLAAFRVVAERLRREERRALDDERVRAERQLQLARALADGLGQRMEGRRELEASGLISNEELLDAEQGYLASLARVAELESDLVELSTRGLEAESRYLDRLGRLTDREQQIAEVEREIARLAHRLDEEGRIVADHEGEVIEISATPGTFLVPGARVGAMIVRGADTRLVSMSYFRVRDGKRLGPDMSIQVTPDTVERERFGGIRGTIETVSPRPVTVAEVESVVGNRAVAEALTAEGHLIQVTARLEVDPSTFSGYRWTSSHGPRQDISAGTTGTARVAVEERPPITFVLPYLKTMSGLD